MYKLKVKEGMKVKKVLERIEEEKIIIGEMKKEMKKEGQILKDKMNLKRGKKS